MIQLRLYDGSEQIVDLGTNGFEELGLKNGDQVMLEGRMRTVHGREAFVVERLQADGRWREVPSDR